MNPKPIDQWPNRAKKGTEMSENMLTLTCIRTSDDAEGNPDRLVMFPAGSIDRIQELPPRGGVVAHTLIRTDGKFDYEVQESAREVRAMMSGPGADTAPELAAALMRWLRIADTNALERDPDDVSAAIASARAALKSAGLI